jgi:hypothetical protein
MAPVGFFPLVDFVSLLASVSAVVWFQYVDSVFELIIVLVENCFFS